MTETDRIEPATRIDPDDAPKSYRPDLSESKRDFYKRLELVNRLEWNGKWRDEVLHRKKERQAILDAITDSLDMKPHQRERARRILSDVPDSMKQGYEIPLLTFCAAAHACRPDDRMWHPDRNAENNDPLFSRVLDSFDFSETVVRKCYHRVENEVDLP